MYCGIDWATDHHDVGVVDADGRVVARGRVGNNAAGFAQLLTLLAEAGDSPDNRIPVGIEPTGGCGWPRYVKPAGCSIRLIRWRPRATVRGMRSRAPNPMPPMQLKAIKCWRRSTPADLSVITQPTFIANGDNDRMVPTALSEDMHRRIPGSKLTIYPNSGHGAIFQYHHEFTSTATEFI